MLQFMDCSNCGKRVRTTAVKCHHCQQPLVSSVGRNPNAPNQVGQSQQSTPSDDQVGASSLSQSHHALNGGYDTDDDDFDYDEFIANEFPDPDQLHRPKVKTWVWVTAWLLIVAMLLPFFFYFLNQ